MQVRRLMDFPTCSFGCAATPASAPGAYRLARLAVKYGAEILLDDRL
jgi:hypothetical protein